MARIEDLKINLTASMEGYTDKANTAKKSVANFHICMACLAHSPPKRWWETRLAHGKRLAAEAELVKKVISEIPIKKLMAFKGE